jgi:hypothetical protein
MKLVRSAFLAVALVLSSGSVARAQDFNKVIDAWDAGDFATAVQELRPLTRQGDAFAQYLLGMMYFKGQGAPQDVEEAVKLYRLAAEQGNTLAQTELGKLYGNG